MLDTKQKKGPCTCPECEFQPFTRNHYFTGKLLVERDFCQEQDYYRNKLRLHEHRLHGSGVVCGLLVKQHPNPACRSRFVCIEPGLAIDCCGHEILVAEEDCTVDLTQLESMKPLFAKPGDPTQYTLQICVRYKECPTEQIPVLYDDCGCDDTRCAPNRILESYEIGVIVDPTTPPESPLAPGLAWKHTIGAPHAIRAALDDAQGRVFVLSGDPNGYVYPAIAANQAVFVPKPIGGQGMSLAVSNDGNRVYVVVQPAPGKNCQLLVLDASTLALAPVQANPIDIPNSDTGTVLLAVAPDGRLWGFITKTGGLIEWGKDIDFPGTPTTPNPVLTLGAGFSSFVLGSKADKAYAVGKGNEIQVMDLTASPVTAANLAAMPAGTTPSTVAVANSPTGDLLAVADQGNKALYLVDPSAPAQTKGPVPLAHPPVGLAVAPDGRWAYVVESEGTQSFAEPVDLGDLQAGKTLIAAKILPLGPGSTAPVLSPSGETLFVPYVGDPMVLDAGGVAMVEVGETSCCGLFWKAAETCDDCSKADCIVLATVKSYVAGDAFTDQSDPPADPQDDTSKKIARIDNHAGRHLLPSTSTLYEAIECLCESGVGGKGPKGDTGQSGQPGQNGQPGLNGAPGTDGQGLEQNLTGIKALSWIHATNNNPLLRVKRPTNPIGDTPGIVIGFTNTIHVSKPIAGGVQALIDADHIFQALIITSSTADIKRRLRCRCPIAGEVIPVDFTDDGNGLITSATERPPGDAKGIAFLLEGNVYSAQIAKGSITDLWVVLRGDFVLDVNGKAVDAEFVRAQLPTGDRLGPSAANRLGLQGGTFESWFGLKQG